MVFWGGVLRKKCIHILSLPEIRSDRKCNILNFCTFRWCCYCLFCWYFWWFFRLFLVWLCVLKLWNKLFAKAFFHSSFLLSLSLAVKCEWTGGLNELLLCNKTSGKQTVREETTWAIILHLMELRSVQKPPCSLTWHCSEAMIVFCLEYHLCTCLITICWLSFGLS